MSNLAKQNPFTFEAVWDALNSEYLEAKAELKIAQEKEKALKEQILEMCNDKSTSINGYLWEKSFRKGNIQYNEIPELIGIDLESYRGAPIEVWKFSTIHGR